MKKLSLPLFLTFIFLNQIIAQTEPKATEVWEPEPRVISTKKKDMPPSDAVVLFDGSNLDQWSAAYGEDEAKWKIEGDHMTVVKGAGNIKTKQEFGDIQLHLEFRTPKVVEGEGQDRGNSGVFLQMKYEVQILDSFDNKTYKNGQCGAIYKQSIPLVNACKKPGEWQSYDIIFMAPVFNKDGIKIRSGYLTVFQNGVLIQNHVEIRGTTENVGQPKNIAHGKGSIMLQDHSNPTSFRNIWLREL